MFVLVSFPFVDLNARAVSCVAGVIIKSPSVVGLFLDCPGILSQLLAAFAFSVPRGGCLSHRSVCRFLSLPLYPLSTDLRLWALYTEYGARPCGCQSDRELELHQSQCHRESRGSQGMRGGTGSE